MKFETPNAANDNSSKSQIEADPAMWKRVCCDVEKLGGELASLAEEARTIAPGNAQVFKSIEMLNCLNQLDALLNQPVQHNKTDSE